MSEARNRTGCLGRLFKLVVVCAGLGAILGFMLHLATSRALQGSWQYVHAGWSQATVTRILDAMGSGESGQDDATRPPEIAKAATRVGNALVAALTANVTLEVTGGGYRLDGSTAGAHLGTSLLRMVGRGPDRLGGCTAGSFTAVFPFIHATCGDGTGRTLWFLMTTWPDDDLELFLLPLGNRALREKVEKLVAVEQKVEAARAAKELLTLRFKHRTN